MNRGKRIEIINDLLSKGKIDRARNYFEWAKGENFLSHFDKLEIDGSFILAEDKNTREMLAKDKLLTQSLAGLHENRENTRLSDTMKRRNKYILCYPHLTIRLKNSLTPLQLQLYLILFGTLPFAFTLPRTEDKGAIDFNQIADLLNKSPNVIYNTYRKIIKKRRHYIEKYPLYVHSLRSFQIEWDENRSKSPKQRQKLIKNDFCKTLNLIAKVELTRKQYAKWIDFYNIQICYHKYQNAADLYNYLSKKWRTPPSKVERTIKRCNDRINRYIHINRPLDTSIFIPK